jgi:integrase
MAHVEKRGPNRWRARYRAPDGRERSRTFTRRVDAERFLATVEVDKARGSWTDPQAARLTFAEWVERYEATTHKRPTTSARDRAVLRRWLLPRLGPVRLGAITPELVGQVVDRMRADLAPATVRTNYGVLRAVMAKAVERDLIGRSPCRGVDLPRPDRNEPRFLSIDELHVLADAMPDLYRPMVYVAGVVGLRWSEVAGLRVGRLDFLRRTVTVAETLAEVEGELMFAEPKSDASRRTVSVPAPVMDLLAEHLARRGRPGPDELVFVSAEGGPLRSGHVRRRVWAPAVEAAGLEGLTFHGLRHTAAGLMIELGAHPRVIQQRLGHASIRTTMDVYGSVLPAVDDAVTQGLGELVADSRGLDADRAAGPGTGA